MTARKKVQFKYPKDVIMNIVGELAGTQGAAPVAKIKEMAAKQGVKPELVDNIITELIAEGYLFKFQEGIVVPYWADMRFMRWADELPTY